MQLPAGISLDLLAQAVDQSLDGITISDARLPDMPLIYVNAGFEKMTGYTAAEVLGKNCRFLQGTQTAQPAVGVLREAIKQGEGCIVILQNYRQDGTPFWNEFNISPVRNADNLITHFIGVQKDVTARVDMLKHLRLSKLELENANKQLTVLAMNDGLTGISNRRHFDEQFHALLSIAQRTKVPLSVLMMDLDFFKRFNDRYGHQAGDDCLILIGGILADAFQRPSDCAARYGGEEFAVVSLGMSPDELLHHAELLCEKVRAVQLAHLDSPHGVVTISVGGASCMPKRDTLASALLKSADTALYAAKQQGRNRVVIS
jgi:diguanylate cyclase (GGDEF)-like protein/PAS domain S-box-containing protein